MSISQRMAEVVDGLSKRYRHTLDIEGYRLFQITEGDHGDVVVTFSKPATPYRTILKIFEVEDARIDKDVAEASSEARYFFCTGSEEADPRENAFLASEMYDPFPGSIAWVSRVSGGTRAWYLEFSSDALAVEVAEQVGPAKFGPLPRKPS